MITAEIIAASTNPDGKKIVSWILKYPRFIHSELMTHRVFSRNAASSRAIPIQRMISAVEEEPAVFEYWGANQKGMQAGGQLEGEPREQAETVWKTARDYAVRGAKLLSDIGLHKQNANRVLEPWAHMTVLVTATEWANFFKLRAHPDAQPEFQVLAYRMLNKFLKQKFEPKKWGEWHIPFGDRMPDNLPLRDQLKVATARAARISYLTFDGEFSVEKDAELHDRLLSSGHLSPFEHCAMASAVDTSCLEAGVPMTFDQGNFKGWTPYRKQFPEENVTELDYEGVFAKKPAWITV